eukprot:s522_g5.t1
MQAKVTEKEGKMMEIADAKNDQAEAESTMESTEEELARLADTKASLKEECDFYVKNFEVRQKALSDEMAALNQAKGILAGAELLRGGGSWSFQSVLDFDFKWEDLGEYAWNGSGVQVCLRGAGGKVLLEASADGAALSLASGELAPSSEALTELQGKGNFQVIAVNNVTGSAEQMARELCNPPAAIWLDLWNTEFQGGLKGLAVVTIKDPGYATAKSVLHGVTLQIPPCSKCAFVGKTGCGKSTTLLCILRFLEARSGRILIGGRDNAKLGLRADPTIFEGTIRFNLDPFDEFPDARIWEAVHSVQLMQFIRTLPDAWPATGESRTALIDGLDTHVDRDGSNVSFGQKQLISLARMVIRQPPVLLLDECTSALDPVTQEAVQKSILRDFPRTWLAGHVIERGTVQELKKLGGTFAKMLQAKRLQLPQ